MKSRLFQITGWLSRWSTRYMKTASVSREKGFVSVPTDQENKQIISN